MGGRKSARPDVLRDDSIPKCGGDGDVILRSAVFTMSILTLGCGSPPPSPATLHRSYKALEEAETAYRAKDYPKSVTLYNAAIAAGSVRADMLGEAYVKLALCQIETGDFAGAEDSLSKAEQGGAVGANYLAAQGSLALKKGDLPRAKDYFAKAKAGDPTIVVPKEAQEDDKKKSVKPEGKS
jgi:tetratricopeptide (TPR) repeat protein